MKKRVLSMLLVLVMVLSMIPVMASAATATPQITQVSMTLNGILDVNFKVASNGADMSKSSVSITGAAAQTISSYTREGDLYVYTAKVPAHKLNETMTVALMYDGASVQSQSFHTWDNYLSKLTGSEQNLAAALNSYGTYAAAYAAGTATEPVSGVTADQLVSYKPAVTVNGSLAAAAALYLDDAVDLRVKFNEAAWQDGYQLKIDGDDAEVVSDSNGKLVYTKEGLLPQDWSHMYDIKVISGETVVYHISYGVNSYVYQALKRETEAATGLHNLLKSMYTYSAAAVAYQPEAKTPIALGGIPLRDPYILNDGDAYYLYGTRDNGSFNVWSSTDLSFWYNEGACLTLEPGDAYYDTTNSEVAFWAPEVFAYNGAYYMFATFTQAGTGNQQATAIFKAESPVGPFTKWSDGFVTPAGHSCLDGTLYIENGVPYMIYAHEWQCTCLSGTGTMDYIQLTDDLKGTVGESQQLFTAAQFSWREGLSTKRSTVTDGCYVYTEGGVNYLVWSTSINDVYTTAYTTFTSLAEGVSSTHTKIYENNGGHGMVFTDMNGVDKLVLHTPNSGATAYPALFNVNVTDGALSLEGVELATMPDVLPVHEGNITYNEFTGLYTMGDGSATAMTADAYEAVELIANFCPDVWPVQGFAVKQGDNTVGFKFGSEGYDTHHIITYVNGTAVASNPATAFAFSLVGAYSYDLKLSYDGININLYLNENGSWKRINANEISLAALIGAYDKSQGVSVGIAGWGGCGRTINNVAVNQLTPANAITYAGVEGVTHSNPTSYYSADGANITLTAPSAKTGFDFVGWFVGDTQITTLAGQSGDITVTARWDALPEIPQVLGTLSGATYDKYTGIYSMPTGYALTTESYRNAELEATFRTTGWPIQGFIIQQGSETLKLKFGSCGYDTDKIFIADRGTSVPTAFGFSLNANTTYDMKLVYDNGSIGIYVKNGDAWRAINSAEISLASYFTAFDPAQGAQLGIIGYSGCGDSFGNVTVTENIPEIPQVLGTLSGATYNKYTGVYAIPTGHALTTETYRAAELEATFVTTGWPIQGFIIQQGSETLKLKFGSCGYDTDKIIIADRGTNVSTAFGFSLNANTTYEMKLVYNNGRINVFVKSGDTWRAINSAELSLASYFTAFDSDQGVQLGIIGYSGCGDSFSNVTVTEGVPTVPDLLSVKDGATYNETTGVYAIPTGSALTAGSYTQAELTASFLTTGWPIQGFAWKQGSNIIGAQFGSCGYGTNALTIFVNGSNVGSVAAINSSLAANTTYDMKMVLNGQYANIFMKVDGAWMRINTASIDLAAYFGSSYDASAGVQIGVMGWSGCGDSFGNIAVKDTVSIADVLSVKDSATFDSVTGLYNMPSGSALTADSYTSVDLRARFVTAGWPIQGFAWKQGDNIVTAQFGSCGYGTNALTIFVNGSNVGTVAASNSSLNGNTAYNMKMTFDGQYANIYMQINGAWTQINTSAIDIAAYMGSSYDASAGVQVGVKGYSGCGDSFDSITVIG